MLVTITKGCVNYAEPALPSRRVRGRVRRSPLFRGQYVRVVCDLPDDESRRKTARVLAVLTSLVLVAAGAISLENRARETLQTSFDLNTMESVYGSALTARSWKIYKLPDGGLGAAKRYPWGRASFNLEPIGLGTFDVVAWYGCDSTD